MKCKKVRRLISDFLCGELPSGLITKLQKHLDKCEDCSRYKEEIQRTIEFVKRGEEIQESIDLTALHDAIISKKRVWLWGILRPRWPVWGAAAFGVCFVLLSIFTIFAAEIQYGDDTLTISFGRGSERQKAKLRAEISAEMNSLYQRTANTLEEYRKEQLNFEDRMSREVRDSGIALSRIVKMLGDYESQRDKQIAVALQHLQVRQNRMFVAVQSDLDALALQTQKEFERNYQATITTVTELVTSGGF